MTWLISKALMQAYENLPCSQAQAAESLAENCSDGKPLPPLSGESTPQAYCAPAKMKGFSRLSRFGMTFKPLTDDLGAELLTWYLAAFPARTSALLEKAQELTGSAAECGVTWLGSLGKYDPDSRSWKTAQRSFLGDLEESLAIWPRSGMTAGGECWELPMLEPITSGTDSGLWPTPTIPNGGRSMTREMALNGGYTATGQKRQIGLENAVKYWPKPTASLGTKGGRVTPRKSREGGTLIEAVSARTAWPTPAAMDYRSPNKLSYEERGGGKKGEQLPNAVGGQLNPMWVEWLQGFPLGWTDLKRLETPKSLCAPLPHGVCLEGQ